MRSNYLKTLKTAVLAVTILLLGVGVSLGQQPVSVTAAPSTLMLPDGSSVPMWGYSCSVPTGSLATCAKLNPAATGWSPIIITVPTTATGGLRITLTNGLPAPVPTSLVIVGQLGGGLGASPMRTPSPSHAGSQGQVTWPIVDTTTAGTPPQQLDRVQSFGMEVAATATTVLPDWTNLRPGTYLIESGTHPSIQGPMGLYGILVVTTPPGTTAGCAYPGATAASCVAPYNAEVPLLMSEIDPVQNNAVSVAVNTPQFSETAVWSGLPGGCGVPTVHTCYPPAVNYTPLYYLFNGVAFDKTHAPASLFPTAPATSVTGSVLVRLVNAGLRMHVPSIVGAQTGSPAAPGFSLIAEDGNPLPGVPRVQSEVFMAAGKTYDVMVNVPTPIGTATVPPALPVFDRELSLSGNATSRDAGMLAYIGANGGTLPADPSFRAAAANPDSYSSLTACPATPCPALVVSDPAKGVIANDVNVYGVQIVTPPTHGTLTLNANGTFSYTPSAAGTNPDSFVYQANGNSAITATVTLGAAPIEGASGIVVGNKTYTSNISTHMSIKPTGVLSTLWDACTPSAANPCHDRDAAGYPLTVAMSAGNAPVASAGLTLTMDPSGDGGFNASVTSPGTYNFSYKAQNSQGTVSTSSATVTLNFLAPSNLVVNVMDPNTKAGIADYRWIIEEDRTFFVDPNNTTTTGGTNADCSTTPGCTVPPTFGTNFHTSYMPVVATGCTGALSCESGQKVLGQATVCDIGNGACRMDGSASQQTAVLPGEVHLDPTKRYYISVLPGDAADPVSGAPIGHGMGGAPIAAGQTSVNILTQPTPFQPAKLSVFVFEDDFPLNGEQDAGGGIDILASNEPGLGGFEVTLFDDAGGTGDATGQPTYDMFNMPLSNALGGTIDPATGQDACPISANARTAIDTDTGKYGGVSPTGITGMIVTCPKYESDRRTLSPLAGQAVVANLYPGRYGIVATPGADRIARGEEWLQTNTLDGEKAHDSFLRVGEPSYFQEYGPAGYHVSIGFASPSIINGRKAGICNRTDPNVTGTNCTNTVKGRVTTERMSRTPDERLYSSGSYDSFAFTQCYVSLGDTDGEDFAFTKCNADGSFTLSGIPDGNWRVTVFDQWNDMLVDGLSTPVLVSGGNTTVDMHDIAMNQWQANIYTSTFFDLDKNGVRGTSEPGLSLVPTNIRFRDGSYSNFNSTDLSGNAGFNEVFPLFSWYVIETDSTRYKSTGTHVVYDAGGPADGTCTGTTAPCGNSTIAANMANTAEQVPLPTNLRVPGAVYCPDADCSADTLLNHPMGGGTGGSTGRIDPPWVLSEGWQGFSGQNSFLEFGKTPFMPGENGGIHGHVVYASTRPFDDPSLLLQLSWEPMVPGVTINLYQEGTAPDGSQSLTLVDTTKTSSWDDWAQGFRVPGTSTVPGIPNMNCPGQGRDTGTTADLFFFTLYNQSAWLDYYNSQHGGPAVTTLPNNSQFKCFDGMHNWNQLQPAPYDGMYQFPSVTGLNPTTGRPTGTNCTICVPNPSSSDASNPNYDPYRAGQPMLPAGKYVVEVVVPPGYELVKEEDKNILIGDTYIAPTTQQFAGLGNIYILPDQAAIGATFNGNNAQNSTTDLGVTPRHEGDTGSVESFWPCVGAARVVPDFISLFPQSGEVSPFAGATRNLCDRKEVKLDDQASVLAKFYVFTSTHVAAHFTGVITDDFTSEFDPFSPQFGEKFSPPNLPISIKDFAGNEVARVYSDQWGTYNGLNYSTWEVNPPNPTGYAPQMMVTCMNDPGNGPTPDPLFNPQYSQFCYEIPFMPGQTQYMDTPVVPTSAFAGAGYNNPDCNYPELTPAIKEVDGDGVGPWVGVGSGSIASVTVTNGGSGYTSAPSVSFGANNSATASAFLTVSSITLGNSGSGYTSIPAITLTGGNGGGAEAVVNDLKLVSIANFTCSNNNNNANRCSLFATHPAVTISGGGGTGAVATATKSGSTISFVVNNGGSGYTSRPTIAIQRTNNSSSTLPNTSARMGVNTVGLTAGGTGYTARPTVTIAGPGGGGNSTATASVTMSVGAIGLTAYGSGYSGSVTVTLSGGGGSGATATAAVGSSARQLTITALGDVTVPNNAYSGPSASTAPFNQKTVSRHYGFGSTKGSVMIGTAVVPPASITTWSDSSIVLTVPGNVPACTLQQLPQFGGAPAQCGQLLITRGDNGKQSIDSVTVTIAGKAPSHVTATDTIQGAIDKAAPGDLIIVDPAVHDELVLMWKPVRLQGVGGASSIINANTQPAGKLDPWRAEVNCLFGLALNGQPYNPATGGTSVLGGANPYDPSGASSCPATGWNYFAGGANNPQVDRLPLEGVVGWDTTVNGNLAELLQEPSLMGAYEGAGITVLAKGVRYPAGVEIFGSGADTGTVATESQMPLGTILLTNSAQDCNDYPSNFLCNPSRIDGMGITDSSQGGGGIFVHAWGHYLEIANNRIQNNAGTLSGGINIGQGESPDALLVGNNGDPVGFDQQPWTCYPGGFANGVAQDPPGLAANTQLPYCYDIHVNVHNNSITSNSSIGDELFSSTPAGGGGVTFCTGADYYMFNYNWLCGNLSTGDGGGLAHVGFIYNGDIEHNTILFNQSTNPTIQTNGGGIVIMGAAPDGTPPGAAPGTECGSVTDADCAPGLSDGTGPGLKINANLIMGNGAESGSGGGIRLQAVNGTEVGFFPTRPLPVTTGNVAFRSPGWNSVSVTNNIVTNNVAGWDGGGISLQDALVTNVINNTIVSNDSTASSGILFDTLGAPLASSPGDPNQTTSPTTSAPQVAGLVTMRNSSLLTASLPGLLTCPAGHSNCRAFSNPLLYNDVFWQNRTFYIGVGTLGAGTQNQQNVVSLFNSFTTTQAVTQSSTDSVSNNGSGHVITGGTGACVTPVSYWDIGVRGDTGPGNHSSTLTLAPTYSVLTDANDYSGASLHNSGANPTVANQYCNGSRTPPEFKSLGYQVPPGIADATVPNPIFNLTPAATVDEGNNWINMSWGPLAQTNPVNGSVLGNYVLATGSPAIDYIPTTGEGLPTGVTVPSTDFFNNPRPFPGTQIDVGAVEFQGTGGGGTGGGGTPGTVSITPNPLRITVATPLGNAGSGTGTVTLRNTSTVASGSTVTITSVTVTSGSGSGLLAWFFNKEALPGSDTCTGATLQPQQTCTVAVRFTNVAAGTGVDRSGTITFTDNATGSPQMGALIGHANP